MRPPSPPHRTTNEPPIAAERQRAIRQDLADRGAVVVSELAERWTISEMTIRRDLDALVDAGLAARVHGGAVATESLQFGHRLTRQRKEKSLAVRKLLAHVPAHGAIYLDGSTTIHHLAELLTGNGLIVATNSIDTFRVVAARPGLRPILVGGELNPATDNLIGPGARRMIEGLTFVAAFCSCNALDPQLGPSEPSPEDAEIKQLVCARTSQVHVAVNHHKFHTRAASSWQPGNAILATDLDPIDPALRPFRALFSVIL